MRQEICLRTMKLSTLIFLIVLVFPEYVLAKEAEMQRKMNRIGMWFVLLSMTLSIFPCLLFAQSQTWARAYGTGGDDEGRAVCQTTDGGYAVTGKWDGMWCILKTDPLGNMLWCESYGAPSTYGAAHSIQQTSDGGYIITGKGGSFGPLRLIKTDTNGDTLWTRSYGGLEGNCVRQTSDGGYIIAGVAVPTDFWVIKTDASGDTQWTRKFDGGQRDGANSVQQTSSGDYIVTGYTQRSNIDRLWLMKFDSTGDTLWTKILGSREGFSVQQTTDEGYIIFGVRDPNYNALLVKTDSSGDIVWDEVYGSSWYSWNSGQQTIDGGYICGTKRYTGANWDDFWLFKTDALGTQLWSKTYGGVGTDIGYCIRQTTDKGYIFVGKTEAFGAGGKDILLIKTDSLGYAPMDPDITTEPSELVFDYSSKLAEYAGLHCPSVTKVSDRPIVPALAQKMKEASSEELIPILVTMSEQLDMAFLYEYACKLDKQDRRQWVISQGQALSQRTQQGLLSYLRAEQAKAKTDRIHALWIVNSISAKVTKDVIREISMMPNIGQILFDDDCVHILGKPSGTIVQDFVRDIVWGVDKIRADSVWINLGYTGEGIVIGNMDTGVNYNHTDLADHMWDGGATYPHHGWNFVSGNDDPMDDNGHGTHTAGTNAGDGTSGTQTGVAPDAQIMALKVLDASGSGSLGNMALGVQFCIYHGADVISKSSGIENPDNGTKDWCWTMCAYAFAADLPMAVAAGNGISASPGSHYPVPHDINTPADVPAPWYGSAGHNAVMAVGATNSSDIIANWSSYGPTEWGDYPYPPGLIKPDVSAPGVNVVSLRHDNNSGYTTGWSGTSMATPHLAGLIALMLEKNPLLTCVEIDSIIENFGVVDLGTVGKDNNYGAGRIDAYDAVIAVTESGARKGTFRIVHENPNISNPLNVSDITWTAAWIKRVKPTELTINMEEFEVVNVYVDSAGLAPGTYSDILWIYSNDPDENPYPEPVTLILEDYLAGNPYITEAEKLGNNVKYTWQTLTGADHYVVYRNTNPSFLPSHADSIGTATDTFYTDIGVINSASSYYYLVKGATATGTKSAKSNMAYKFNKFFNENPGPTSDKNWVSLPWYSGYNMVSDLTSDLSLSGDPLNALTNLRDDQLCESWVYDPIFSWIGTDFSIVPGSAYELVTIKDTSLVFVGANDPNGLVVLNENPGAVSDRNWVSIPYNAAYSIVSDITVEYSPSGDPLTGLTNLRDDQLCESWVYDPIFGWIGTDFSIVPGCAYELVVIIDTTWDPTEYTNEAKRALAKRIKNRSIEVSCGNLTEPNRTPVWKVRDNDGCKSVYNSSDRHIDVPELDSELLGKKIVDLDADYYEPVSRRRLTDASKTKTYREVGISHNVIAQMELVEIEDIVFTAYRVNSPSDVLTEQVIGCGVVKKDDQAGIWFNTANFKGPWEHGEEVMLIIEATRKGKAYFNVMNFKLDKGVDIQNLGEISLVPLPDAKVSAGLVSLPTIDNEHIVGYSLYQDETRLNDKVITTNEYTAVGDVNVKPVIKGGYETVYANSKEQVQKGSIDKHVPLAFSFGVHPSPFTRRTQINYALPVAGAVDVVVYDATGKRVKTLVSEKLKPGYYKTAWQGDDEIGRTVAAGVYFILLNSNDFASQRKVIFVH